jgi:uncharacterized membrane protein YhaH (DUF805 family)
MLEKNPYNTPESTLDNQQTQFYKPKILSFSGRLGRLRYLAYGIGANLILSLVMMPIIGGTMSIGGGSGGASSIIGMIAMGIFYIGTFVFAIMFAKRRLNDLNKSGWWFLLFLVPVVNLIMTIYLIFFSGTDGNNQYGPVPVENTIGVKLLAFVLPVIMVLGILSAIAIPAYMDYVERAKQSQMQPAN